MPELPEVETIARGLSESVLGRRILSVRLGKTDFIDDPIALEQHLPGKQITAVERHGKFMLLRLAPPAGAGSGGSAPSGTSNGDGGSAAPLFRLWMAGPVAPHPGVRPRQKQTHACFLLDDRRGLR